MKAYPFNSIQPGGTDFRPLPSVKRLLSQVGSFNTISVFLEILKYVLGVQGIIKKNVKKDVGLNVIHKL